MSRPDEKFGRSSACRPCAIARSNFASSHPQWLHNTRGAGARLHRSGSRRWPIGADDPEANGANRLALHRRDPARRMSGRDLAEAAGKLRPDLKVLFTTGYARDAIVHNGRLDANVDLLSKPFSFAELASRLRRVLDAASQDKQVPSKS